MTTPDDTNAPSLTSWLRTTWAGWVLGVPCTILLALAGEALGIGGMQVLVGAGMGAGVGLLQGRAVRRFRLRALPWFWSSVTGLALPFLAWDLGQALGVSWTYSLPACVALGGLLAGSWQAVLLRRSLAGPTWWVLASALGWTLAGAMAAGADRLVRAHAIRGLVGAGTYLALVAAGGLILGLLTGLVLANRWRPQQAA